MARYYALPTLMDWNDSSGWSLTSGGSPAGARPGAADGAVFDANSGASRTITATSSAYCMLLDMKYSAPMSIMGNMYVGGATATGVTSLVLGGSYIQALNIVHNNSYVFTLDPGTPTAQATSFGSVNLPIGSVTLASALTVTDAFTMQPSTPNQVIFNDNNFNVTCRLLTGSAGTGTNNGYYPIITMGNCTWTITGTLFNITSVATVNNTTGTNIVLTSQATNPVTFNMPGNARNFWYRGKGSLTFTTNPLNLGNARFDPGTTVLVDPSYGFTAATIYADGSGNPITIATTNSTGTPSISLNNVANSVFNYCVLSNVNLQVAGPARLLRSSFVNGATVSAGGLVKEQSRMFNFM